MRDASGESARGKIRSVHEHFVSAVYGEGVKNEGKSSTNYGTRFIFQTDLQHDAEDVVLSCLLCGMRDRAAGRERTYCPRQ